jgi:CSLREA domain-containing protein
VEGMSRTQATVAIEGDGAVLSEHRLGGGIRAAFCTLACAAGLLLAGATSATAAETYVVNITGDPAPGPCEPAPGDCSLREAVSAANFGDSGAAFDVIQLQAGQTYTLSIPGTSAGGDLDVNEDVAIQAGSGAATIVQDAAGQRVIEAHGGRLDLFNVNVAEGEAPLDNDGIARGGGIRVNDPADLRMIGGSVTNNGATVSNPNTYEGVGIWSEGEVSLDRTLVRTNVPSGIGFGGGMYLFGNADGAELTVVDSIIRDNEAGFGGGIAARGQVTGTIRSSRIGRNRAGSGGGVFLIDGPSLDVERSNIDNNEALSNYGGGLRALEASFDVQSSTITANSAPEGGGIAINDQPGGAAAGNINLANTIVADNRDTFADDGLHNDCADQGGANVSSSGYNLVGFQLNCIINPAQGDQLGGGTDGSDPPIIPLLTGTGYFGGPEFLLMNAIQPKSPARNTGAPPAICGARDLRGVPRDRGGACDTGAYELVKCGGVIVNRVGTAGDDDSAGARMAPTSTPDGMLGFAGDDRLSGAADDDGLCGLAGDDRLRGDEGDDELDGGAGRDVCVGGPGRDTATGCEVERSIP